MSDTLRSALRAIAVKTETTTGTDAIAGTPANTDFIGADFSPSLTQDTADNPEITGSLDAAAPIATGIHGAVEITIPLRGSGAPGTAPEWGRLLKACGWAEIVTASAVGAPTAATAGTGTSVTAGTPFAATAQAYRGMPLLISGTPASALSLITDYTAAKLAALSDTYSPALGTSALLQVPINVLYAPSSDESLVKPVTVYLYEDGLRHRLVGCVGTWKLDMTAGKTGALTISLRGQVLDAHQAVSMPTAWNTITRPTVPVWVGGKCQFNRAVAKSDTLSIDAGLTIAEPENPEAPQGFDPPIITARRTQATLAPYATTTLSPGRFNALSAGTSVPFAAVIGATAGNRIGITMPSNRVTRMDRGKRNALGVDQLTLQPDIADAGVFLCQF